jgi:hypothetical protein
MKKIITALLALLTTLAIVLGGVTLAAPAQAVTASITVDWRENKEGVAYAVRAYKTNGTITNVRVGSSASGVWKVCPFNYNRLSYRAPNGTSGIKAPGQCLVPSMTGLYHIGIRAAS